jgi:predicted DCC family thiol-disulfide oxidoreductase YuxK
MTPSAPVIVLFDGECNFCSRSINFILNHDPAGRFRFASQQSTAGAALLKAHGYRPAPSSVIVIDPATGRPLTRSAAVLRIADEMPTPWWWLRWLGAVVPGPVRDALYDAVANNRYRLFGKSTACMMLTAEMATRFLDSNAGDLPQPPAAARK